jgi:hypothetical protein
MEESYQLLMQEHFPGSTPIAVLDPKGESPDPLGATSCSPDPVLVDQKPWINAQTLDLAFKQFNKMKCPGPDGYRPIVLCNLPPMARSILIILYNAIIALKYTPLQWRNAEVIFLPKPGKDDYTERRAFRPISLMPFLFKTLERLVKWKIEAHALSFHKHQHAFRKSHCTENALSYVVDRLEKAISEKQTALVVFLDIKGAFDNLSSEVIAHGMYKHEVDDDITGWMQGYLNHRFCRVKGSKQYFRLIKGTGQGGILSPMIWNFVMDTFLEIFHTHAAEAIAYADDGALVIIHEDTDTAQHLMQTALDKAQSWAETVGLEFSISKTKAMLFSREKDPPSLSSALHMCDEDIEVVETFKYLGVTLDSRLDWNPHVDHKVKMAKRYLMMIHQGIGTTWGPSPAITLWLYTGIVRPFLTYGSVVWARKTSMVRVTNKLKKVQRLGMLMVAPMRSHTPTAGLEIILGVPPLDLYIQFLAATTSNRLNLQPLNWDGKKRIIHRPHKMDKCHYDQSTKQRSPRSMCRPQMAPKFRNLYRGWERLTGKTGPHLLHGRVRTGNCNRLGTGGLLRQPNKPNIYLRGIYGNRYCLPGRTLRHPNGLRIRRYQARNTGHHT